MDFDLFGGLFGPIRRCWTWILARFVDMRRKLHLDSDHFGPIRGFGTWILACFVDLKPKLGVLGLDSGRFGPISGLWA